MAGGSGRTAGGSGATADGTVAAGCGVGADAVAAVDAALASVAGGLRGPADLAVVFLGAAYVDRAGEVAAAVRSALEPGVLVGVSAGGVVAGDAELERPDAVSVWAGRWPGAVLTPFRCPAPDERGPASWPEPPGDAQALLVLADPFSFPADAFLSWVAQARPGLPVSGGLASAAPRAGGNRLLLDREVHADGAVGVAIGGDVAVRAVVSQGCRPIGDVFTVTRADGNLVQELAGATPVERIQQVFTAADRADRDLMRQGLHLGVVVDEYRMDFGRGDFLIRGVIGAQAGTGALAVGEALDVGRTVQFQVRDARSADEDLRELLAADRAAHPAPAGALVFTCNGRGRRLFGTPDHDAALIASAWDGTTSEDPPAAGFFAAGELGPVGDRSFVHGFTVSLLLVGART